MKAVLEKFLEKLCRAVESEDATETEALLSAAEQGQAGTGKFFYFTTFVQAALIVHELHLLDLASLRQVTLCITASISIYLRVCLCILACVPWCTPVYHGQKYHLPTCMPVYCSLCTLLYPYALQPVCPWTSLYSHVLLIVSLRISVHFCECRVII